MSDSSSDQSAYSARIHSASDETRAEVLGIGPARPRGTMVILSPQRTKTEAPKRSSGSLKSAPRSRWGGRAALVASTAAIGGLAGSLAVAGIFHFTAPSPQTTSYYAALVEGVDRLDRELAVLKSASESSTKATEQQVAEIVERVDRIEKASPESGAKPGKSGDPIDRTERRLAAATGDVTGAVAGSNASVAAAHAAAADAKQPSPLPIVDGWVVRDVYHGAALIQNRAGMIEVLPGDNLPGLGRIQQVRRQDGHWVVVTSRGQIVSR